MTIVLLDLLAVLMFWILLTYAEGFLTMTSDDVNDEQLTASDFTVQLSLGELTGKEELKALEDQENLHYQFWAWAEKILKNEPNIPTTTIHGELQLDLHQDIVMNVAFGKAADHQLTVAYNKIGRYMDQMKLFARRHSLSLNDEYEAGEGKDWWIDQATEARDDAEVEFGYVEDLMNTVDDAKVVYVWITFQSMIGK